MKSLFVCGFFLAAGLLASGDANPPVPTTAPASYARGVIGGPHDFSGAMDRFADACRACHVPHILAVRPTTQPSIRPTFEMRMLPGQRRVFEAGRFTPGPSSVVCLGCHDGTVATSTIGSAHALLAGAREGFGVPDDLALRDHPIGVPYPSGRRDYRPASFVEAEGKVRLPEGRLECISCHDPHNRTGVPKMLVKTNRRSALCLTCHVK